MGKIADALEKTNRDHQRGTVFDTAGGMEEKQNKVAEGEIQPVQRTSSENRAQTHPSAEPVHRIQPVTGRIDRLASDLIAFFEPQSVVSERIKILRTNILFPEKGEPPRSILVTSALPDEGKTFIASNLAISIAAGIEEHVLLIDCDMRNSCIHSRFGFGQVAGLTEYLTSEADLPELILRTPIDKLSILPGGRPAENPAELLSSHKMSELIEETKVRYIDRYIVIDAPPPLLTAEASALARQVDGIVVVTQYGKTPRQAVADLVDTVGREKILGIVFNWYENTFFSYDGYSKYHGYYGTGGK